MWGDELAIAVNLPSRTVSGLVGPLAYRQVAPWGWLVVEKALFELFGPDERVLRLPSMVAALLVLVLTAVIAGRAAGSWAVVAAVAMVGASPTLLYYAGELKQYAVEAAVALGLLVMGDEFIRRCRDATRPTWTFTAGWAVIATAAVTLSYPGLLVLGGTVGGLAAYLTLRRRWAALSMLLLAAAPAALIGARATPSQSHRRNHLPDRLGDRPRARSVWPRRSGGDTRPGPQAHHDRVPAHGRTAAGVGQPAHGGVLQDVTAEIRDRLFRNVIQSAVLASRHGITVAELATTFHPYLTVAEALKLAAQACTRDVHRRSCCA